MLQNVPILPASIFLIPFLVNHKTDFVPVLAFVHNVIKMCSASC